MNPLAALRARKLELSLIEVAQLAVPVFLALSFTYTIADADLWGHLRFGADLLHGSGFSPHDPYSFTSDTRWINHEWLAEITFAVFFAAAGGFGLNVLKLSVITLIGWLVWQAGRQEGGRRFALILLTGLALFASYTRTQVVRPQLFSVLFFAALMMLLRRRENGERGSIVTIPALFAVWVNTHGGWLVGFGTLCVWAGLLVVERRTLQEARRRAIDVLGALAATLINPYGVEMWQFLQQTVGLERDISDWTPFFKFPVALMAIELTLPVIAAIAVWRRHQFPPMRHAAILAILAFATYRVGRVDAFLHIAIAMLLAPALIALFNDLEAAAATQHRLTHRAPAHAIAAAALIVFTCGAAVWRGGRIHIAGPWIPDGEALQYLQHDVPPNTRLLTWFDWGEYAIWHLSPLGIQVSMDGRRETVYSDRVLSNHWAFYRNQKIGDAEAWAYPDIIGADLIWLPKHLAVVGPLRSHGWTVAWENETSMVFSREPRPVAAPISIAAAHRVFPGP